MWNLALVSYFSLASKYYETVYSLCLDISFTGVFLEENVMKLYYLILWM